MNVKKNVGTKKVSVSRECSWHWCNPAFVTNAHQLTFGWHGVRTSRPKNTTDDTRWGCGDVDVLWCLTRVHQHSVPNARCATEETRLTQGSSCNVQQCNSWVWWRLTLMTLMCYVGGWLHQHNVPIKQRVQESAFCVQWVVTQWDGDWLYQIKGRVWSVLLVWDHHLQRRGVCRGRKWNWNCE